MDIDLNPQFQDAIKAIETTDNHVFITGRAGVGKSTFLTYFCRNTLIKPVVLAPTGVAALNINGQTIHRFFNFYIDVTIEKVRAKDTAPRDSKIYRRLSTIIIDEVSMLRADLLDCIDTFLRLYGPKRTQPFGGVQMVFVGDLYQLPPVVGKNEKDIFRNHYDTPYFFSAKALRHLPLDVLELETVYRQKDPHFVRILDAIRNNSINDAEIKTLNARYDSSTCLSARLEQYSVNKLKDKKLTINLTTTNKKADRINEMYLQTIKEETHGNHAVISGDFTKEYYPTTVYLQYKIGAQIMLLNNDHKKRWVNGSIGIIEDIKLDKQGEEYIRIFLTDTHKTVSVYPFAWEIYKFSVQSETIVSEPAGSFTQYPFRLAWAITIHKSQGKTFDSIVIDISEGSFVSGQIYVALSRCKSLEGIRLMAPIKKYHIFTDRRLQQFLKSRICK